MKGFNDKQRRLPTHASITQHSSVHLLCYLRVIGKKLECFPRDVPQVNILLGTFLQPLIYARSLLNLSLLANALVCAIFFCREFSTLFFTGFARTTTTIVISYFFNYLQSVRKRASNVKPSRFSF